MMINEGPNDPDIFKVIFMAGTPGAGKSTIAKYIQSGTGLKMVNFDELYEYLKLRSGRNIDFGRIDKLLSAKMDAYLNGRLGMIIDKTSQDYRMVSQLKNIFDKLGYDVAMVFVNTPLNIAKQRVLKRASETGRHVSADYLERAYNNVTNNLGKYQSDFSGNLFIVDNSERFDIRDVSKRIQKFLNKPHNHIAKKWIDSYYDRKK